MPSTYYLSSLDSYMLAPTRKCEFVGSLRFDTGKECVVVVVDPPIPGHQLGLGEDLSRVLLANRHEGESLNPISSFPCFVFVARPLVLNLESLDVVRAADM